MSIRTFSNHVLNAKTNWPLMIFYESRISFLLSWKRSLSFSYFKMTYHFLKAEYCNAYCTTWKLTLQDINSLLWLMFVFSYFVDQKKFLGEHAPDPTSFSCLGHSLLALSRQCYTHIPSYAPPRKNSLRHPCFFRSCRFICREKSACDGNNYRDIRSLNQS